MEMEEAGLVLGRLDVPEPSISTEGGSKHRSTILNSSSS
jgi:hypothetical protein